MVQLEEVTDESYQTKQKQNPLATAEENEEDWDDDDEDDSDDESTSSTDSSPLSESIWDRLSALTDIIPPSTRRSIQHTFLTTQAYLFGGSKIIGNLAWAFTTSAILVGLPFMLAVEDESRFAAQEREMMAQQQMMAPQQQQAGQDQPQGIRPPGF